MYEFRLICILLVFNAIYEIIFQLDNYNSKCNKKHLKKEKSVILSSFQNLNFKNILQP